ncbi:hypothetical protein T492DRAFT_168744 [Pavlovales sp. CCMP2436]|nr:hypothetical protein T492DRAFT_168744 [Pavlovales sp. CCMP2436]
MPPKPTSTKPEKTKSAAPKKGDKDPSDAELLRAEAMAIVPDLLWDAFDGAIEVLEQKRLASRVTDFTATCLREAILSTLELFHIGADPGETDLLDSTWTADEEPKPVTNDAWSREILQLMGPEQRPRVRSRPKTALGIPSKGRGISFNASGRPSDASGTVSNANWSAHARLFDAPAPPLAREDVTQPKVDTRKVDAEAARVPPRSDAEADAALVPKARLDRQLSREVRDDAQHALAMHEHFGGKDYVYGSNLKALVSMPVSRPELLPRLLATPGARYVTAPASPSLRASHLATCELIARAPLLDPPPGILSTAPIE